jgi:hypothetical protein
MTTDYENIKTNINVVSGAWTSITIPAAGNIQGADLPCRFCRLQNRDSNAAVRVRIGDVCTDSTGVGLPSFPVLTPYPVSNVNMLYFYGTSGNVIDCEYFR